MISIQTISIDIDKHTKKLSKTEKMSEIARNWQRFGEIKLEVTDRGR